MAQSDPTNYDRVEDIELKKEAFMKSSYGQNTDNTVRVIEAFAGDKMGSDKLRPGSFNRHVLFGSPDKNEVLAHKYLMRGGEVFRSIYAAAKENSAERVIESHELVIANDGLISRARDGRERKYLSKTVSEIISSRSEDPTRKKGLGRLVPFRGGK